MVSEWQCHHQLLELILQDDFVPLDAVRGFHLPVSEVLAGDFVLLVSAVLVCDSRLLV
jgi:hypothetical protein